MCNNRMGINPLPLLISVNLYKNHSFQNGFLLRIKLLEFKMITTNYSKACEFKKSFVPLHTRLTIVNDRQTDFHHPIIVV